jgi:hypothetical protein
MLGSSAIRSGPGQRGTPGSASSGLSASRAGRYVERSRHDRKDQAAGRRGGRGPRRECGLALVPGTPAEAGTVAACTSSWGSSPDMARIVCRESDFDHTLWSQNHVYYGLGQMGTPAVDGAGISWDSCVNGRPGRHPRAPDAAASVVRLPTRREDSPGTSEATSNAPRSASPGRRARRPPAAGRSGRR